MSSPETTIAPSDIAVIGMACRFPGAPDVQTFWRNLQNGVESIRFFSEEDALAAGADPAVVKQPNHVRAGGVLDGADLFDAGFFGVSPIEAQIMDPQHRLLLEVAWEALEASGHAGREGHQRTGVFAGAGMSTYLLRNLISNKDLLGTVNLLQVIFGNDRDSLATRISYKLDLKGPAYTLQTFCSTSLVATHVACQSLLSRECDLALAGGVSVAVPQGQGYLYEEGGLTSPDGHCRAYDRKAQGTPFGNGGGMVVLKRMADAVSDGDVIHAVIKGSAINNDGGVKVSYAAPSVTGQAEVIAEALCVADVDASTIGYVEGHGSGTALGDPIEIAALTKVFGEAAGPGTCALGSVKSNIGHLDRAAGIAGLMKGVLSVREGQVPPSLHFEAGNEAADWAKSPFFVSKGMKSWPKSGRRRAGVSSFGVGGTNAHVVLEQAPERALGSESQRAQLLVLSAKTSSALQTMSFLLADCLEQGKEALADVAYTLACGRGEFGKRRVVVCKSTRDAAQALRNGEVLGSEESNSRASWVFPGVGDAEAGLGAGLYQHEPRFREELEKIAPWLQRGHSDGTEATTRLRLFAVEYALARTLESWGLKPSVLAGEGVGEYVAAVLAGLMQPEDAVLALCRPGPLHSPPHEEKLLTECVVEVGPSLAMDEAALAQTVGKLWLAGQAVDWKAYYRHEKRNRVALPTYPFERSRYWVDASQATVPAPALERKPDISDWFYTPVWRERAPELARVRTPQRWLAFINDEVGFETVRQLKSASHQVVTVRPGSSYLQETATDYVVREGVEQDVESLVKALTQGSGHPERVLHGGFLGTQGLEGFYGVVAWAKAVAKQNLTSTLNVAVLTCGAQDVTGAEELRPWQAAAVGISRVLPQELPNVKCRHIDVGPNTGRSLKEELEGEGEDVSVALRRDRRWVQDYQPIKVGPAQNGSRLRPRGVYLITGGVGRIGLALGEFLAREVGARLVMAGRTALPPRGEWKRRAADESCPKALKTKLEGLLRIEAEGGEVLYTEADVADSAVMQKVLDAAQERFGPVNGLIHAAGATSRESFQTLDAVTRPVSQQHFGAKVQGLEALAVLLPSLDFALVLSSISTVLGGLGFAAYAASNAVLDAMAAKKNRSGNAPWLCVNLSDWVDGTSVLQRRTPLSGLEMSHIEGIETLRRVLGLEVPRRLVHSTCDLEPRLRQWVEKQPVPFIRKRHARPALRNAFVPPDTDAQKTLASLWEELLGIEQVGIHDNFFEIGGNSLLGTQLASRLRIAFDVAVPLRTLFEARTIAELAPVIEALVLEDLERQPE